MNNILAKMFGWGTLDVRKLLFYIDFYEIEPYDVYEYINKEMSNPDKGDFNTYLYAVLCVAVKQIKKKMKEWLEENKEILTEITLEEMNKMISEYEPLIYTNYLDSSIEGAFGDFNYKRPTKEQYIDLVIEIIDKKEKE